jgi:hypothetical protein
VIATPTQLAVTEALKNHGSLGGISMILIISNQY